MGRVAADASWVVDDNGIVIGQRLANGSVVAPNVIRNYTAAQLSALAAAGGLTQYASYVASDTGRTRRAISSFDLIDDAVDQRCGEIHVFGNHDWTTRQGQFVVPAAMTVLEVSLYAPGGNGGVGNAGSGAVKTGGGAGSPGEVLERARFPVIPGHTVAYQIGAAGAETYLKHDSHTGTYLSKSDIRGTTTATVASGLNGGAGNDSLSGAGAAGVGTFYGRTAAAAAAGRGTAGNGANAGALAGTFTASKLLGEAVPKKVGGLGGAAGGYIDAGVAADGGFGANVALIADGTNGIDGLTGQQAGGVGDTTHAGGGSSSPAIQTRFNVGSNVGRGGGVVGSLSIPGSDALGYSAGGGGNATGGTVASSVGYGGAGHIIIHNWLGSIYEAPPARVLYEGAGRAIHARFYGDHIGDVATRTNSITSVSTASNTLTLSVDRPFSEAKQALVFTAGTPPSADGIGVLQLGVSYPILPVGPYAGSNGTYNTIRLALTDGGAELDLTSTGTAGSTLTAEVRDVVGPDYAYSLMRSLHYTPIHWGNLHTADGTYAAAGVALFDQLKVSMLSSGRRLIYVFMGTPNWCAAAGPTANNYASGAQEPPNRTALGDGKIPIRQFTNWLVTNYGAILDAIEVWNEPSINGVANGFSKTTGPELVQIAADIRAELTLLGSSIPLLAPGFAGSSSSIGDIRKTNGSLHVFLTSQATVTSEFGRAVVDAVAYHPYNNACMAVPPLGAPMGMDSARIVTQMRRMLENAGVAAWATMPIWMTEQGIASSPGVAGMFPQASAAEVLLSMVLSYAATGAERFIFYGFNWGGGVSLGRDLVAQQALGDFVRQICGKTLTYCAVRADNSFVTTTVEGGTVMWRI